MNVSVYLHSGYFWHADQMFTGWPRDLAGVGVALDKVKKALPKDRVFVKSRYDSMSILAKKAIEYGQLYTVAKGKKLLIIPKNRFRKEA